MEEVQSLDHDENRKATRIVGHRSDIDTSRPFRSVKEAVAIFGERFLVGDVYSPKPFSFHEKETPFSLSSPVMIRDSSWKYSSPSSRGSSYSHDTTLTYMVKRLEDELEETKAELKLLKVKEFDAQVALASLNIEFQKNILRLSRIESIINTTYSFESALVKDHGEEEMKRDLLETMGSSPSPNLAQVVSVGEEQSLFLGRKEKRKGMRKKAIIPFIGNLFSKKKGLPTTLNNPLYASSPLHSNSKQVFTSPSCSF
ncbi:WEB family protein [Sesamum alatum]|uniref:WEB family protein n=1 Tax=Sesamum alatum TaxID=300844 RepID=A0AAE1Y6D1_9LAMI|nr:WEB family protein [Sesamum alatum]